MTRDLCFVTPLTEKIKLQKLFSEKRLTSEKLITRRILQYHVIYLRMSDALLCPLVFDFYEIWTDSGIRQRISFSKCQTCSAFGDLKAQFIMSNEREFKKWEIWKTSIPEQKMNSKNIPMCTVFLLVKFCFWILIDYFTTDDQDQVSQSWLFLPF